jgi:hypothetical protein
VGVAAGRGGATVRVAAGLGARNFGATVVGAEVVVLGIEIEVVVGTGRTGIRVASADVGARSTAVRGRDDDTTTVTTTATAAASTSDATPNFARAPRGERCRV